MGYREVVMADTPVSFWRLGESSGATAVDEMGAHDGAYVVGPDGAILYGQPGLNGNDPATSVQQTFPTNDGYVQITDHADFDFGNGAFSLEIWFLREFGWQFPGNYYLFDKAGQFGIVTDVDDKFHAYNDSVFISRTNTAFDSSNQVPHHLVMTHAAAATTNIFYVDGAAETTAEASASWSANATDIFLFRAYYGNSSQWNDTAQDAAIYDYVLTPTQVGNHRVAGLYDRDLAGQTLGVSDIQKGTI